MWVAVKIMVLLDLYVSRNSTLHMATDSLGTLKGPQFRELNYPHVHAFVWGAGLGCQCSPSQSSDFASRREAVVLQGW